MKYWQKIIANAVATGAITALSILAAMPAENITTAAIYAAVMAGAVSGLKEYKDMITENDNKGKRIKNGRPNPLGMLVIF